MEDARALLDSLMGPSRDKSAKEQQRGDGWKDKNVCKRYLIGFCPNNVQDNWFKNTKRDVGTCTKIHSDRLKDDFEKHPEKERYEIEYERDFLFYLEGLIREADAWIAREKRNCKPAGIDLPLPQRVKDQIDGMKTQSDSLMKMAEELAEKSDIPASKEAVQAADRLREEIETVKNQNKVVTTGEEVCEVCGVRCQPGEIADYQAHLDGKLHEAYALIRQKTKELREKERNRPPKKEEDKQEKEQGRDRAADRDRRHRGDDRDREERHRRPRSRSRSRRRRR